MSHSNNGSLNSHFENSNRNSFKEEASATPAKPKNVRNIPIFLEDRNETILNVDKTDSATTGPKPSMETKIPNFSNRFNDESFIPNSENIRMNIPVHQQPTTFRQQSTSQRQHFKRESSRSPQRQQQYHKENVQQQQSHQQQAQQQHQQQPAPPVPLAPQQQQSDTNDPIYKIQTIQKEVLALMEKVEQFEMGGTKSSTEYNYLDEMLTQNLLKLDTIDAEGKENIKACRKEVINCINKCIAVLESKVSVTAKTTAS